MHFSRIVFYDSQLSHPILHNNISCLRYVTDTLLFLCFVQQKWLIILHFTLTFGFCARSKN